MIWPPFSGIPEEHLNAPSLVRRSTAVMNKKLKGTMAPEAKKPLATGAEDEAVEEPLRRDFPSGSRGGAGAGGAGAGGAAA